MKIGFARWAFNIGWALLLVLGVAAIMITAGKNAGITSPKVSSYEVSGVSALADLLRLRGYEIVVDPHPKPKISPGDVVVAFTIDGSEATVDSTALKEQPVPKPSAKQANKDGKGTADDQDDDSLPADAADTVQMQAIDSVRTQATKGATVFWLNLPSDFESASSQADAPISVMRPDGQKRSLSAVADPGQNPLDSDSSVDLATTTDSSLVTAQKQGDGVEIEYSSGVGLTNRYIAKADNAQFFLETLKAFAPNARRVIFPEATFGNYVAPGLLETLGPWAEGAWYQILFLLAVILYTLNRRFGLPRQLRRAQTGGRELVDALTDIMTRAAATSMSLENTLVRADQRIRSLFKIKASATAAERDAMLSPELMKALVEVRAAAVMPKTRPNEALELVINLEKQLQIANQGRLAVDPSSRRKRPQQV